MPLRERKRSQFDNSGTRDSTYAEQAHTYVILFFCHKFPNLAITQRHHTHAYTRTNTHRHIRVCDLVYTKQR